jgi:hypothetical protein
MRGPQWTILCMYMYNSIVPLKYNTFDLILTAQVETVMKNSDYPYFHFGLFCAHLLQLADFHRAGQTLPRWWYWGRYCIKWSPKTFTWEIHFENGILLLQTQSWFGPSVCRVYPNFARFLMDIFYTLNHSFQLFTCTTVHNRLGILCQWPASF